MLAATLLSALSARAWVDDGCSLDGFAAVPKGTPGAASKTLLSDPGVSGHSAPRIGVWVDGLLLPGPIVQFTRHSRPLCSQLWMPCAWMAVNLNRHSRRILLSAGHRCWCEQMVSAP